MSAPPLRDVGEVGDGGAVALSGVDRLLAQARAGLERLMSLAAASLQSLGLGRATDVIGGVEAWVAVGLPTHQGPADVRE